MCFVLTALIAGGQKPYTLKINVSKPSEAYFIARLKYNKTFSQPKQRDNEVLKALYYCYDKGYLAAHYDSLVSDSNHVSAYLFIGDKYKLSYLGKGNVEDEILREAGYKFKHFSNSLAYNQKKISRLMMGILEYCENNGFPFASVSLDSINIKEDQISASLNLSRNQRIIIDTIMVKGDSRIHMSYLQQCLGIKPGDYYDESKISKVGAKLKEMPFASVIRPFEVAFTPDKASLILYLEKKKASQFDGILGIAPNNDETGKVLITGDVTLKLMNILRRGELIDFQWRKLEQGTQDLKFNFVYPYLFKTPFGVDYRFYLYKRDTSFITLDNHIGVNYLFKGYNYIQAYYEHQASSLLSTTGLEFATVLPPYADVKTSFYGIKFGFDDLDYRFNPRRGFSILSSGAVGKKTIKKNENINPELYEGLQLESTVYRLILNASTYVPVYRNLTFLLRTQNGYLNNQDLFENELFRIGGLQSLRGFDEESIFASFYSILTCEFRYLFDVNSFFSLFWNGAYFEQNTYDFYISDYPWGFGAGLSFDTKAGIFSISYALGKQFDNPIQFKSAKIHFGLTATF